MAVSKIEMTDKVSFIIESVSALSNGTDNFAKIEIPYHKGYRPLGILSMAASGTYDGYRTIHSWYLTNEAGPNPRFEVYWTSSPGANKGVAVKIFYLKI